MGKSATRLTSENQRHYDAYRVIWATCLTIGAFSIIRQEASMTEERVTPLRQRMIEDMRIRGMDDKAQKSHIRAIKDFAAYLGRSPDTSTPVDMRAFQLHMPNRIFFGHVACHVLAGAFLLRPPLPNFYAERIVPGQGFAGSHIYVTNGQIAYDYHGYCSRMRLLPHFTAGWAKQYHEGWNCALEVVEFNLLDTGELNKRKMLGPDQYRHNSIPRARNFIERVNHHVAAKQAARTV
jgi:hypothetical protein